MTLQFFERFPEAAPPSALVRSGTQPILLVRELSNRRYTPDCGSPVRSALRGAMVFFQVDKALLTDWNGSQETNWPLPPPCADHAHQLQFYVGKEQILAWTLRPLKYIVVNCRLLGSSCNRFCTFQDPKQRYRHRRRERWRPFVDKY